MTVSFIRWSNKDLKRLNNKESFHVDYGIYVMRSKNRQDKINYKSLNLKPSKIYRVGAVGVNRLPDSLSGNTAAKRLIQVNAVYKGTTELGKSLKPWVYIFGCTINGVSEKAQLRFAASCAEGLLQYYFSEHFRYLGKSHFYCTKKYEVKEVLNCFFARMENNTESLFGSS